MDKRRVKQSLEHIRKRIESRKGGKGYAVSEETKNKISKANTGKIRSEETKRRISQTEKGRKITWGNKISLALKGKKLTDEHRLNLSKAHIGIQAGENHYNWQGGKSFEPYNTDWTETLKRSIRERDKYICQLCEAHQDECNRMLAVHHIDYNKQNCNPDNLITLCMSCHIKTNYNRDHWVKYFLKVL